MGHKGTALTCLAGTLAAAWVMMGPAQADPMSRQAVATTTLAAFDEGRFETAARLSRSGDSADAKALAARALLAEGICGDGQPPAALLDEADRLARAALDRNPDHLEGQLQLAIALSLKARPLSTREAMRTGYGGQARDLARAVLKQAPDNGYAHGFLSVWHLEVVRRGGALGATVMGASVGEAVEHYREADRLLSRDPSVHWQFARALAAHDARAYRGWIDYALSKALVLPAETAVEETMAARARRLKDVLEQGDLKAAERLAQSLL